MRPFGLMKGLSKRRRLAAVKIQKVFRGFLQRKKLKKPLLNEALGRDLRVTTRELNDLVQDYTTSRSSMMNRMNRNSTRSLAAGAAKTKKSRTSKLRQAQFRSLRAIPATTVIKTKPLNTKELLDFHRMNGRVKFQLEEKEIDLPSKQNKRAARLRKATHPSLRTIDCEITPEVANRQSKLERAKFRSLRELRETDDNSIDRGISVRRALRKSRDQLCVLEDSSHAISHLRQQKREQGSQFNLLKEGNVELKEMNRELRELVSSANLKMAELKKKNEQLKGNNQKLRHLVTRYKEKVSQQQLDAKERRAFYTRNERAYQDERQLRRLCEETLFDIEDMINNNFSKPYVRKVAASKIGVYLRAAGKGGADVPDLTESSDSSSSLNSDTSPTSPTSSMTATSTEIPSSYPSLFFKYSSSS